MAQKHDFFVGFLEPENNEKDLAKFICETDIWLKFFGNKDTYAKLQFALLGKKEEEKLDGPHIRHKVTGYDAWGDHANFFLEYCTNKEKYDHFWGTQDFDLSKCLKSFERFNRSIPQVCTKKPEYQIFLMPARRIRIYLEAISKFCNLCPDPDNISNKKWRNAGMYTLISLFVQNGSTSPEYKTPKGLGLTTLLNEIKHIGGISELKALLSEIEKVDNFEGLEVFLRQFEYCIGSNSTEDAADTSIPSNDAIPENSNTVESVPKTFKDAKESFGAPESKNLPFDLFAYAHNFFAKHAYLVPPKTTQSFNPMIRPAEVHRKRISISREFCHSNKSSNSVQVFLVDEYLSEENARWYLRRKLSTVPLRQDAGTTSFELQTTAFEDNSRRECAVLDLTGNGTGLLVFLGFTQEDWLSSNIPNCLCSEILINASGHLIDPKIEKVLKNFQIRQLDQAEEVSWRTITVDYNEAYLDIQFIDLDHMNEIPIIPSQNQVTGTYELSLTIPCPSRLVAIKVPVTELSQNEGALHMISGYLHGIYGLQTDINTALQHLLCEVHRADFHGEMAFQYGAHLRKSGFNTDAELFFRKAGRHPGARFNLASLLLERDPNSKEAEKLLDALWLEGYRTYGSHMSIDLLNKHIT